MTAADGLDVASFVVNIFIATGTLLAAGVALYLGLAARNAEQERDERQASSERRQITIVVMPTENRHAGEEWATIDVINGSPDVITNIVIALHTNNLGWHWTQQPPSYLVGQGSFRTTGSFHTFDDKMQLDRSTFVSVNSWEVHTLFAWKDAHGQWWARRDGGDPYMTDGVKPGRDTKAYLYRPTRRERLLRKLKLSRNN
jgi:hypothetical protein